MAIGPQTRDRAASAEVALLCEIRDQLEGLRVILLASRDSHNDLMAAIRATRPETRCVWGCRCKLAAGHASEHEFSAALEEVVSRAVA
jgi:hypothetical protein